MSDTSVLVNGQIGVRAEAGELRNCEVIVPQVVVDELYSLAEQHRRQGWAGLETLREISEGDAITVTIHGNHAAPEDAGRVAGMVVDTAKRLRATLYTSDRLQQLAAQAEGVDATLLRSEVRREDLGFVQYFDSDTMSVHLKEGMPPAAKRGGPGSFIMVTLDDQTLERADLERMADRIADAGRGKGGMIEIEKPGALVVQYEDYRIAVTRPPFSESVEITVVHPLVQMSLDDYDLSEELMERLLGGRRRYSHRRPAGLGQVHLGIGLGRFLQRTGTCGQDL